MSVNNIWTRFQNRLSGLYNENKNIANIVGGSIIFIVASILFWSLYWHPKREHEAALKVAKLQHYMETDSFAVILNGIKGKKMATAPQIADSYFLTKKGKEAALMSGIAYLHTAKYEKAIKYFDKTDAHDLALAPAIQAAKGSCYAELGKPEKAAKLYEKAAEMGDNEFTSQFYKKAGIQYDIAKDYKSAIRCFEKLKSKFGKTAEGTDIEKYIYRLKGYLGELNN